MKPFLSVALAAFCLSVTAASAVAAPMATTNVDTLFCDANGSFAKREAAFYYILCKKENDNYYKIDYYYVKNNQLERSGHCTNPDSLDRQGPFVYYLENGRMSSKGSYHNNKKTGTWEHFYDLSSSPIWYTSKFDSVSHISELKSYYSTGELKRTEKHRFDHVPAPNAPDKTIEKDNIIEGHCYSPTGKEISFTTFEKMAYSGYDLGKFLSKNLRYPASAAKNNIEGRVMVKFVVTEEGEIRDAVVTNHVSDELDAEALRVVRKFPDWKPGIQDDKPVKVFFTLPIRFKLN